METLTPPPTPSQLGRRKKKKRAEEREAAQKVAVGRHTIFGIISSALMVFESVPSGLVLFVLGGRRGPHTVANAGLNGTTTPNKTKLFNHMREKVYCIYINKYTYNIYKYIF